MKDDINSSQVDIKEEPTPNLAFERFLKFWRGVHGLSQEELARRAGVGLRFDMPGFPIRIDRAWSIESDSELTDTDNWVFWVGFD